MITALIYAAVTVAYGFLSGVTTHITYRDTRCDSFDSTVLGLFWPVSLPAVLGSKFMERLDEPKLTKATARELTK